jgi:hypothetical protein
MKICKYCYHGEGEEERKQTQLRRGSKAWSFEFEELKGGLSRRKRLANFYACV